MQAKNLTDDKLALRHWPCNPICSFYDQEAETTVHLCIHCLFAKEVWVLVKNWVGEHTVDIDEDVQTANLVGEVNAGEISNSAKKQRQPS